MSALSTSVDLKPSGEVLAALLFARVSMRFCNFSAISLQCRIASHRSGAVSTCWIKGGTSSSRADVYSSEAHEKETGHRR